MAIKLTVYISDEGDGVLSGLTGDERQEHLNKLADDVIFTSTKHADYYMSRMGDATVVKENWA